MSIPNAVASSSKKVQSKHKVVDGAHQSGHKKETKSTGKKEKSGPFEHRLSRMRLSVAPKYSADWLVGVREVLDGMLMR